MKWIVGVLTVVLITLVVVGERYGDSIGLFPLFPHPRGTYQVQAVQGQAQPRWFPIPMQGLKITDDVYVHPVYVQRNYGGYVVDVGDYSAVFSLCRSSDDPKGVLILWRTTPDELLLAGVNERRVIGEDEVLVLTVEWKPNSWSPKTSVTLWLQRVPGTDDLFQVAVPPPSYN